MDLRIKKESKYNANIIKNKRTALWVMDVNAQIPIIILICHFYRIEYTFYLMNHVSRLNN